MNLRSILIIIWMPLTLILYGPIGLFIRLFSKSLAEKIAKNWVRNVYFLSGCKINLIHAEKLKKDSQYIFLANHQSLVDIVALIVSLPYNLSFIAKKSLFRIPFFGWGMRAGGHIAIDRSNPAKAKKSIQKASSLIKEKRRSIFAFPEGTRSETGEMAEFKLGIFNLAIKTGIDIVPVTINGTKEILPKKSLKILPGQVDIILHDPIKITGTSNTEKLILAEKTRSAILQDLKL